MEDKWKLLLYTGLLTGRDIKVLADVGDQVHVVLDLAGHVLAVEICPGHVVGGGHLAALVAAVAGVQLRPLPTVQTVLPTQGGQLEFLEYRILWNPLYYTAFL